VSREWGDGADDIRKHIVVRIRNRPGERWVACRCGTMVIAGSLSLEDAWDTHRGQGVLVAQRLLRQPVATPWADDEEVHQFLERAADPAYEFGMEDA
jgi:hypothetical protein